MTENNLVVSENNNLFEKAIKNLQKVRFLSNKSFVNLVVKVRRRKLALIYEKYINLSVITDSSKKESIDNKYNKIYESYLQTLNKYIVDNVYPRVIEGKASYDENKLIEEYLKINVLKKSNHVEYKYKRQRFLLNLDLGSVIKLEDLYIIEMFKRMYVEKMDIVYRAIIKNCAIKLVEDSKNEKIYKNIFNELEEYLTQILKFKIELDYEKKNDYKIMLQTSKSLEKYKFETENTDKLKFIEKNMMILNISRNLFEYSLPIIAAEQCYIKLIKDVRKYIVETDSFNKKNEAYDLLITLIESYNIQLLAKKVYWNDCRIREEYDKFWKQYQRIAKLENIEYEEYKRQKESLFIYYDLKILNRIKTDKFNGIKQFYRIKLKELKGLRKIRNKWITLSGKYIKVYMGKKNENSIGL
ncbi:MAG: hypothetical protein PHH22_03610 [Clostridia bacterium]|nr:hypothetical protein [Clostridia bacterium]